MAGGSSAWQQAAASKGRPSGRPACFSGQAAGSRQASCAVGKGGGAARQDWPRSAHRQLRLPLETLGFNPPRPRLRLPRWAPARRDRGPKSVAHLLLGPDQIHQRYVLPRFAAAVPPTGFLLRR